MKLNVCGVIMVSSRIFVLILCSLFGVSCLNAQEDVSQKAKELLRKGKENEKRMSYKATIISGKNSGNTITVYNKSIRK